MNIIVSGVSLLSFWLSTVKEDQSGTEDVFWED